MSEIHDNIDYSEETMNKHRAGGCPLCGQETGIGHAWMIGVPLGAHYTVYDSGTWAWPDNRIGFADAIAFAAENGQDVWAMHDTCGKEHDGVVWSFLDYFPEGTEGHRPPESEDHQAKVTLGKVLPNECLDSVLTFHAPEIVIHWSKRPAPQPPPGGWDTLAKRGPRKRPRK